MREVFSFQPVGGLQEKLQRLDETIEQINRSMTADDFYEGDRLEIERSRDFFEGQKEEIRRQLGESSIRQAAA